MANYRFEDCRRGALEHLGDAADWLRYIDAPATKRQQELARQAIDLIGRAKAKLDEAARSA